MLVELDGIKMTGSARKALEWHWASKAARDLYHAKHMINKYGLNLVWWDGVEKVMYNFPKVFQEFATQHTSKFCWMNRQLSRIDPSVENISSSSDKEDESSKNIFCYTDDGRQAMWHKSTEELLKHLMLCDMV